MSHRRYTKQVLITSISSLLLCCLTFLGTTYAWFTDSVTSGVNTIQAGSLQVDLVNENNESIVGKQAVFHMTDGSTDLIMEPGMTFVSDPMYVANQGNLALMFQIKVDAEEATQTSDGKTLLDVITFTVNGQPLDAYEGVILPAGQSGSTGRSEQLQIEGHMPKTVGNEYQGLTIGRFQITVVAKQYGYESDGFGTDYDQEAQFPGEAGNGTELNRLLKEEGKAKLSKNMEAQRYTDQTETYTYLNVENPSVIDLGGHQLTADWLNLSADVTIKNGTLVLGNANAIACSQDGINVTLEDVILISDQGVTLSSDTHETYVFTRVTTDADIKIENKYFTINDGVYNGTIHLINTQLAANGGTYSGQMTIESALATPNTITIYKGSFLGFDPTQCAVQMPDHTIQTVNLVSPDSTLTTTTTSDGAVWYLVSPSQTITDAQE